MSKLIWNDSGHREYHAGVDRGVLYPRHGEPVVWNGLTSVVEAPSDAVAYETYLDGRKDHRVSPGSFAIKLEALTYPEGFKEHEEFDFTYRTSMGSDVDDVGSTHLIHIVYNAFASSAAKDYRTAAQVTNPAAFSWDVITRAMPIQDGSRNSAHLIVNTGVAYPWVVSELEDILYGTESEPPRFPTPEEVITIFEDGALVKITDHGDGTWTADGPDYAVYMISATEFEISWPSAVYVDVESYTLSSL